MARNNKYDTEISHAGGFKDIQHHRYPLSQTAQRVLNSNTNRCYAYITNNTGYSVWVKLGAPAVKDQDIVLKPADRFEITSEKLWLGEVYLIAGVNQSAQFIEVAEGY